MACHGRPAALIAAFLLIVGSGTVLASAPGTGPEPIDLKSAMLKTYVHGVNDALAAEVVREADLPELRLLLLDPSFPRRDNVVAFLAHRDGDGAVGPLLALLHRPPADLSVPEEDRAILLAPQALGQLARRGSRPALDALLAMTADASGGGVLVEAAARSRELGRAAHRLAGRGSLQPRALRHRGGQGPDRGDRHARRDAGRTHDPRPCAQGA